MDVVKTSYEGSSFSKQRHNRLESDTEEKPFQKLQTVQVSTI